MECNASKLAGQRKGGEVVMDESWVLAEEIKKRKEQDCPNFDNFLSFKFAKVLFSIFSRRLSREPPMHASYWNGSVWCKQSVRNSVTIFRHFQRSGNCSFVQNVDLPTHETNYTWNWSFPGFYLRRCKAKRMNRFVFWKVLSETRAKLCWISGPTSFYKTKKAPRELGFTALNIDSTAYEIFHKEKSSNVSVYCSGK